MTVPRTRTQKVASPRANASATSARARDPRTSVALAESVAPAATMPEVTVPPTPALAHPSAVDHDVQRLMRQMPLPLLVDGDQYAVLLDAVEMAADSRQGVVALGAGDCGKSVTLSWAVQEFEQGERRLAAQDPAYRPRRVVRLNASKPKTPIELLCAIYRAALDTDPMLRVRGRAKTASEVLRELVVRMRDEDVAVVVLDDADALSAELLELIAGLMAVATDDHPDRLAGGDLVTSPSAVTPQGTGVVLAGTARLETTLAGGSELGNAWKKLVRVGPVAADAVPLVLQQLLPTWREAAVEMGDAAWSQFVRERISYGRAMPIGALDSLARLYVRRSILIARETGVIIRRAEELPWDAALLEQVRTELLVPRSTYTAGFSTDTEAAA